MTSNRWLAAALVLLALDARAAGRAVPKTAKQMVVVVTDGWDATQGMATAFAYESAVWRKQFGPLPVSIGRSGMAWGRGLHGAGAPEPKDAGPVKKEGDGRSPAGVFSLDGAMGYDDRPGIVRLPYRESTATVKCVDDSASTSYNRIVDTSDVPVGWASAEDMRREDELYRRVILVGHNAPPVVPQGGSCIFLHQRRGPDSTTAGCTAFDAADIDRVFHWLDIAARPVLVQLPRAEYKRLKGRWDLPSID